MKRLGMVLLFSVCSICMASAQISLRGTVRYAETGEAAAGASVIVQTADGSHTYGYCITDGEGAWQFEHAQRIDSVKIMVTGFNLRKTSRIVRIPAETADFEVEYEELQIKEVKVKAEPLRRRGDTLSYYVSAYIDTLVDRSIGDVLRKMPGIDVSQSGRISYNNRPINRFYIENLDMMGGRYGVAVNNLRASDIAAVDIMENHQPVKALAGFEFSPDAAINLRLKSSAKGSLIATLLLGAGYKPWLWTGELALMYFTGKWQLMATGKTNDTGQDVRSELESFYDALGREYSELSIHIPASPDIGRDRYRDNVTHAASFSQIRRLGDGSDHTLNVNAMYLHDRQRFSASSLTAYYLPGKDPVEVEETTVALTTSDEMEVKAKYNLNSEAVYLNEQLAFGAKWDDDDGSVMNGTDPVGQQFRMRQLRLQNDFRFTRVFGEGVRLNFSSRSFAAQYPASLQVTPVLYPEIFGYEAQAALQEMDKRKFRTDNTLHLNKSFPRIGVDLNLSAGFTADLQSMTSALQDPFAGTVPDDFRNEMLYSRCDLFAGIGATFRYKALRLTAGVTPDYALLATEDRLGAENRRKDRLFLNPALHLDLKLTPDLSFIASGSSRGTLGAASGNYSGYILTDYRVLGSRSGELAETVYDSGSAELRYADAIRSLFASLKAGVWRSRSNLMYGTVYSGSFSQIDSYAIDNTAYGWNVEGKVEKRFDAIATTVGIPVGFRKSSRAILRQGELMNTASRTLPVGLELNTRLSRSVLLDYACYYEKSRSRILESGQMLSPIRAFRQKLDVNFLFLRGWAFKLAGEHYGNDAPVFSGRPILFLDASLKYRAKKVEYSLEGRNLLNTRAYNHHSVNGMTDWQYSCPLRPASVLFTVRFSLGA